MSDEDRLLIFYLKRKGDLQSILCITRHFCLRGSLEGFTYEITRSILFSVNNSPSKRAEN